MKKLTLYILAVLLALPLAAQEPDAVYKLIRQEWTVNADGTSDYHYRHEAQILRNRALTAYADKGETFVVYNPDLEDLTINEVYTITAGGKRVAMPQNAFIYQLPSSCADCGRFNHIKELAMVHTGMELGCTVVVDYTIHRRYNLVNHSLTLVKEAPVEQWEVSVKVPAGQEVDVQLTDPGRTQFNHTVDRTNNSYTLIATDLQQSHSASYLPPVEQLYPTLHFYNGVPQYSPAFDSRGLPASADVANQLLDSRDKIENIQALRDYVVDNIHLNDIAAEHLGYSHATAEEVWRTGCGTATDKAVLLAAMLNEQGFQAQVAGEQSDEVDVLIDTLNYRLSVRSKDPASIYGKATDEVLTDKRSGSYSINALEPLQEGFYRLNLLRVHKGISIDARRLSLTRTAPLQGQPCDISFADTYAVGKDLKLLGGNVHKEISYEGVGSLQIDIKQKGKNVKATCYLKLEQSVVGPSDYAKYRELVATWQTLTTVVLHKK